MARQTKTAAQRAEEALANAQRKVDRLEAALDHQRKLAANYEGQLTYAKGRRDYLAQDPDLPEVDADLPDVGAMLGDNADTTTERIATDE